MREGWEAPSEARWRQSLPRGAALIVTATPETTALLRGKTAHEVFVAGVAIEAGRVDWNAADVVDHVVLRRARETHLLARRLAGKQHELVGRHVVENRRFAFVLWKNSLQSSDIAERGGTLYVGETGQHCSQLSPNHLRVGWPLKTFRRRGHWE